MTTLTVSQGAAHSAPRPSLIRRLAGIYRRTPGGIEQTLYSPTTGAPARMETLLGHLVRFGAVELARRIVARFQAVIDGRQPQPLSTPFRIDAQQVDCDEDVAQLAYELDPSDANLERYARAKEKQAYTSAEEAYSLRAEQKRRRP